jgi:hypothetical protein
MSQHIIHQQKIEISSRDEKKSTEIFTETSRLFNSRIKDATERLFNKYCNDDVLLRVESLEIDMGNVTFPFSEEDFVNVYKMKLEEALSNLLKNQSANDTSQEENNNNVIAVKSSLIQLLEQFLLTGTMLWWAGNDEFRDNVKVFKNLLGNEEADLKKMIERNFSTSNVRKRLVYSFTEDNVRSVIHFIQPSESKYIYKYHSDVSYLQQESRFVSSESIEFRKALWLFILDYLAEHSESRFNRKMFVKSTIKSIADKFNMRFEEVLFYFSEALNKIPENFKKSENLISLIEEISFEQQKQIDVSRKILGIKSQKNENEFTLISEHPLFFYLINGFFPFDFINKSQVLTDSDLIIVINKNVSYSRLFFLKYGKEDRVIRRIVTNFEKETFKTVVKLVEPSSSETIFSYTDFTINLQKKTSFIKTEEKVFRQSLWSLVLSYLFSDRGSVFNSKMFLISNIKGLSQHYNIDYKYLLAILVQGIGQQRETDSNQLGLFYILTEILAENKKIKEKDEKFINTKLDILEEKKIINEVFTKEEIKLSEILKNTATEDYFKHKNFVLNVFLYLLEFGELPWWAGSENTSVLEFINKGRKQYLNEFRKGFIYAVKKDNVGINFIEKYSSLFKSDLIFLFENSPLLELLNLLLNKLNSLEYLELTVYSLDIFYARSLISSLYESSNGNPDLRLFFSNFFLEIEKRLGVKTKKNIVSESSKFISQIDSKQLKDALNSAEKDYSFLPTLSITKYSDENFKQVFQLTTIDFQAISTSELIDYITKWIIYYAKNKKFPDEIKSSYTLSEREFLVWMHEYLYRNNKNELIDIFSERKLNSTEQQFLLAILQNHSMKLEVRNFIEPIVQKLVLLDFDFKESELVNLKSWTLLIQQLRLELLTNNFKTKWITLFKQNSIKIFISQHASDDDIKFLFEKFEQSQLTSFYQAFIETFFAFETDHFERQQLRKWIIEFFLEFLSGQTLFNFSSDILANQFAKFIFLKTKTLDHKLLEKINKWNKNNIEFQKGAGKDLIRQLQISINKMVQNIALIKSLEEELKLDEEKLQLLFDPDDKKRIEESVMSEHAIDEETEKVKQLPLGERIYIRNAGMILLHPFISTLFTRSNLIKERTFVDEESQAVGIWLLQYAATGAEDALEHELILNKILVGMPPEDVIIGKNLLNDEQKELINGMINAILIQWDKMKNTSVEGFRNSFLIRDGYIFRTEEEWVLRVEKRAYDILLDTLPWSFGMIKFSWMNKPIIVEWT